MLCDVELLIAGCQQWMPLLRIIIYLWGQTSIYINGDSVCVLNCQQFPRNSRVSRVLNNVIIYQRYISLSDDIYVNLSEVIAHI